MLASIDILCKRRSHFGQEMVLVRSVYGGVGKINCLTQTGICACNVFNTFLPGQFDGRITDDYFKFIFFNENVWIWIKISMKFVLKAPIDNKSALVQVISRISADPLHRNIYAALGGDEFMAVRLINSPWRFVATVSMPLECRIIKISHS